MSGTDVCRALKATPRPHASPSSCLTAKGEEIDRVVGASRLGADDYVVKPYSMRELTLRLQAILRRRAAPAEGGGLMTFGRLRIDREGHRVWVDGDGVAHDGARASPAVHAP